MSDAPKPHERGYTDRFALLHGKFGPYFYDHQTEAELPLLAVLNHLNQPRTDIADELAEALKTCRALADHIVHGTLAVSAEDIHDIATAALAEYGETET